MLLFFSYLLGAEMMHMGNSETPVFLLKGSSSSPLNSGEMSDLCLRGLMVRVSVV